MLEFAVGLPPFLKSSDLGGRWRPRVGLDRLAGADAVERWARLGFALVLYGLDQLAGAHAVDRWARVGIAPDGVAGADAVDRWTRVGCCSSALVLHTVEAMISVVCALECKVGRSLLRPLSPAICSGHCVPQLST